MPKTYASTLSGTYVPSGEEIIEHDDVMPHLHERIHQVRADKTGPAGNQNAEISFPTREKSDRTETEQRPARHSDSERARERGGGRGREKKSEKGASINKDPVVQRGARGETGRDE